MKASYLPMAAAILLAMLPLTSPRAEDYCPELQRTNENPLGLRDCGPGCIPEDEFSLESALSVLQEIRNDLVKSDLPVGNRWERSIGYDYQLTIIEGALLRRDMMRAKEDLADPRRAEPWQADDYETSRAEWCEFLRKRAIYLD
jgi:hypothetical protein